MDNTARTLIAALRNSHERLAALAGPLSEEQLTGRSYCTDWTVGQVLSHLGSGAEIMLMALEAALGGPPLDRESFPQIWAAWDGKPPRQQAADAVTADDKHIARFEGLSDEELAGIRYELFGTTFDGPGLIRLRLAEHAVHTWDVAVALDPAAEVAPDAVELLMGQLPMVAGWAGKPKGEPFRVRLRGSEPEVDFVLDAAETVSLSPWPGEGPAGAAAQSQVQLPAEALLRLVYGRLDPGHTPPVEVTGDPAVLDRLRAVFPGL